MNGRQPISTVEYCKPTPAMTRNVKAHISASLSNTEWAILRAFCEKTKRLSRTKLVVGGESEIRGSIKIDRGKGLLFEAALPPEEQIAEFLMAFRFFYLQNESTNFLKILSLLGKHTATIDGKQALKGLRNQWDNALFKQALQVSLGSKPVTASVLIDLWFNAHYFHTDSKKVPELEMLTTSFSTPFAKLMLLDSVYEATKLIFRIYDGVREVVETKFSNP